MNETLAQAFKTVEEVYDRTLDTFLNNALKERLGYSTEKKKEAVDLRFVRLMAISGKGGWSENPELREKYQKSTNVTLLDHLLSVMRGAMSLAIHDWNCQGILKEIIEENSLRRRLVVIAAIALLHDLDKMEQLPRGTELSLKLVEEAIERYGMDQWLKEEEIDLNPDQLLVLIGEAEDSSKHRYFSTRKINRHYMGDIRYVKLADKLDGEWLAGGVDAVMKRLEKDVTLNPSAKKFYPVTIFDPHHPFLLDVLQAQLSLEALTLTGIPPLIEFHHDGQLIMLLSDYERDAVIEAALDSLILNLPFSPELTVSNRGIPMLQNFSPTYEEFSEFVKEDLSQKKISDLFKVKASYKESLSGYLNDLLKELDLIPYWASGSGQLLSIYGRIEDMGSNAEDTLRQAAEIAMLVNLKVQGRGIPDSKKREQALLATVEVEPPTWITEIADDASRRIILSLWAITLCVKDEELDENIFGETGLLLQWIEGTEKTPGFRNFIPGKGAEINQAVKAHFKALLSGKRILTENEQSLHHCLFTGEPVSLPKIQESDGLYEVKVSAFSGRDGRLESLTSDASDTHVGPVSQAEHKLRMECHNGIKGGTPTLIYSPTTSGLFGGLNLKEELGKYSLYDLCRKDVNKGQVYYAGELYKSRLRMARYERVPEKLEHQIQQLRMLVQSTRRLGRPIHVFKGLPIVKKEFFYYDAMPPILKQLLGGNAFRLEQLKTVGDRLELAETLINSNGLGYETLRLYASPNTRFRAICLAYTHLEQKSEEKRGYTGKVSNALFQEYQTFMEKQMINEQDQPLVQFGKLAAEIQSYPRSNSKEMMVFQLSLEAAQEAKRAKLEGKKTLVYAVAGNLETNLIRRGDATRKRSGEDLPLQERCLKVAEYFVDQIWLQILEGRAPAQRMKRILGAVFRMAFLQESKRLLKERQTENRNTNDAE